MKPNVDVIKIEVRKYLSTKGWPNISNPDEFIIEHLQDIFLYLLKKKLVQGEHWLMFKLAAEHKYFEAKLGV